MVHYEDPRLVLLAKTFCNATQTKKGDRVVLHCISVEALPLMRQIYYECLRREASRVSFWFTDPTMEEMLYRLGSDAAVGYFPQFDLALMKETDVFMATRARENPIYLVGVDPKRVAMRAKAMEPILDQRVDHTRWCITYCPTDADAMLAGMSTSDYVDYFLAAATCDYGDLQQKHLKLKALMEATDQVRILASDTDITFSIRGLPAISCHGEKNLPDGEVYTAPVRDSVNGYITFNVPTIQDGREYNGVRLEFEAGKIKKATCAIGDSKALNALLDTDEGARYTGEFAIGTNLNIRRPGRNILFDEKIFGSIHLTPGRCYEDCDNGNHSAIHWDQVKILTGDGTILFDGVVVQKNGIFVHSDLLNLNPPDLAVGA